MADTETAARTSTAPAGAIGTARTRLLLEAPILPTLLRLAAPNIVLLTVQAVSSSLDALFVGRLGPQPLAGISLVFPAWMLMVTMSSGGVGGGVASAIARALGARRQATADDLVAHSLVIALVMSGVFTAGMWAGGPLLFRTIGGTGAALQAAVAYSQVVFSGAIAIWLVATLASILRATGGR